MEPLLSIKAESTTSADQICSEQVVTSLNSIQITFSNERGYKGKLVAREGCKAINIKAAIVKSAVFIILERDGKQIDSYDLFGIFDESFN